MAIKSKYHLPASYSGKGWQGELLPKVGERSGMRCIYKIRMDGDSKRAGLYLSDVKSDYVVLDVAGDKFLVDLVKNEIKYDPKRSYKYSNLPNDPEFQSMLRLTLAHFCVVDDPTGLYTPPPPKVTALTEDEAAAIAGFGIF